MIEFKDETKLENNDDKSLFVGGTYTEPEQVDINKRYFPYSDSVAKAIIKTDANIPELPPIHSFERIISDPYADTYLFMHRLIKEYMEHGKLIVAYDFDDTVFDYHKKGFTYDRVINLLRKCHKAGFFLIVSTSREDARIPEVKEYLEKNDIPYDLINENAPFVPYTAKKIYYNVLLDDRAGLRIPIQSLEILLDYINEGKVLEDAIQELDQIYNL